MRKSMLAFTLLLVASCSGPTDPIVLESTIVDEVVAVPAGDYRSFAFNADLTQLESPSIFAAFSSDNNTTRVSVLVMTQANFTLWSNDQTYDAVTESPLLTSGNVEVPIFESGTYHAVISNKADTVAAKNVAFFVSVLWTPKD